MNTPTTPNPAVTAAVNQAVRSLTFPGVSKAAQFLAKEKNIDLMNARDCIYKALRTTKGGKTHGFKTARNLETREVILTEVVKG